MHALELIHGLLSPAGELIDIHPLGERPLFEVRGPNGCYPCGYLLETDDGIEYPQATAALLQAVQNGWFKQLESATFRFTTHADSPDELFKYLEQQWSDAVLLPEVIAKVEKHFAEAGPRVEVRLTETVTISRFIVNNHCFQ